MKRVTVFFSLMSVVSMASAGALAGNPTAWAWPCFVLASVVFGVIAAVCQCETDKRESL
jgi:hypothetical protein